MTFLSTLKIGDDVRRKVSKPLKQVKCGDILKLFDDWELRERRVLKRIGLTPVTIDFEIKMWKYYLGNAHIKIGQYIQLKSPQLTFDNPYLKAVKHESYYFPRYFFKKIGGALLWNLYDNISTTPDEIMDRRLK